MLANEMTFDAASGSVNATVGAATAADRQGQGGFGFMTNGDLAIDTDAPAGDTYVKGLRLNSSGAVYGTTSTNASDAWLEGIRISASGQLVYEVAAAVGYTSGNPYTATGVFSVI
jgi:hypothetical protein